MGIIGADGFDTPQVKAFDNFFVDGLDVSKYAVGDVPTYQDYKKHKQQSQKFFNAKMNKPLTIDAPSFYSDSRCHFVYSRDQINSMMAEYTDPSEQHMGSSSNNNNNAYLHAIPFNNNYSNRNMSIPENGASNNNHQSHPVGHIDNNPISHHNANPNNHVNSDTEIPSGLSHHMNERNGLKHKLSDPSSISPNSLPAKINNNMGGYESMAINDVNPPSVALSPPTHSQMNDINYGMANDLRQHPLNVPFNQHHSSSLPVNLPYTSQHQPQSQQHFHSLPQLNSQQLEMLNNLQSHPESQSQYHSQAHSRPHSQSYSHAQSQSQPQSQSQVPQLTPKAPGSQQHRIYPHMTPLPLQPQNQANNMNRQFVEYLSPPTASDMAYSYSNQLSNNGSNMSHEIQPADHLQERPDQISNQSENALKDSDNGGVSVMNKNNNHALDFIPDETVEPDFKLFDRFNQEIKLDFKASLDGKFYINEKYLKSDSESFPIACYRRNYVSLFMLLHLNEEPAYLQTNGRFFEIENLRISINCKSNFSNAPVELTYFPSPGIESNGSYMNMKDSVLNLGSFKGDRFVKMKRFQFKKATPNNGKYIAKDYYYLILNLEADLKESTVNMNLKRNLAFSKTLISLKSNGLSVRGRNPQFYTERNDITIQRETSTCFKYYNNENSMS